MTFKPMTYLVSFTMFVLLFMALGGYVGYGKIADSLLTQAFLDARPISVQAQVVQHDPLLHWEETIQVQQGLVARIVAENRSPVSVTFSDETQSSQPAPKVYAVPLAPRERIEDVRVDSANRYLYVRVFTASNTKSEETTWLHKFDLKKRKHTRQTAVNPILLPAPFKP